MDLSKRITIVTASDNHYLVLLAALLKSIEINHETAELIDFYIVGDRLSKSNINKFSSSFESDVITLHWLKMSEVIPPNIKLPADYSSYPKSIYLRLFMPYFLPPSVDKAIYMDVDMITLVDISELWNIELGNNIVGAVMDSINTVGDPYGGVQNYKSFNMVSSAKFFNTGLLIMNLNEWKKFNVTQKVIDVVSDNKVFAKLPDQYGLNVVLYEKWLEIDQLWNYFSDGDISNPKVIHFSHRKPIYKSYDKNSDYKILFFKYLDMTKWVNFEPMSESTRYMKKLLNVFEKLV